MTQNNAPSTGQTNINLHQQKLYSLIIGGVCLIGMILPWSTVQGFGGMGSSSSNGFGGWGILSLFGIVGVIVSSLFGDKTITYDQNMKYVAIGSFATITLGAFIAFMQISGKTGAFGIGIKSGIGLWFCIIPGIIGLLWVAGVLKVSSLPTNAKPPAPPSAPPPPPPK